MAKNTSKSVHHHEHQCYVVYLSREWVTKDRLADSSAIYKDEWHSRKDRFIKGNNK